MYFKEEYTTFY